VRGKQQGEQLIGDPRVVERRAGRCGCAKRIEGVGQVVRRSARSGGADLGEPACGAGGQRRATACGLAGPSRANDWTPASIE